MKLLKIITLLSASAVAFWIFDETPKWEDDQKITICKKYLAEVTDLSFPDFVFTRLDFVDQFHFQSEKVERDFACKLDGQQIIWTSFYPYGGLSLWKMKDKAHVSIDQNKDPLFSFNR